MYYERYSTRGGGGLSRQEYNTRLRLVLYSSLDPSPRAISLVIHSLNLYIINSTIRPFDLPRQHATNRDKTIHMIATSLSLTSGIHCHTSSIMLFPNPPVCPYYAFNQYLLCSNYAQFWWSKFHSIQQLYCNMIESSKLLHCCWLKDFYNSSNPILCLYYASIIPYTTMYLLSSKL